MQDLQWLDNLFWHAMSGPLARFTLGNERVRRLAPGFSPIVSFDDPSRPDFAAVEGLCQPGEQFYTDGWSGPVPPGWRVVSQSTMCKMYWTGGCPDAGGMPAWVELGPQHAARAVALAELTRPGPFGPRTRELGDYLGLFADEQLVAMAGERMRAGPWREVSGVCTHPDHVGRGHARALMLELIRRQQLRGERTCLHVMSGNASARRLYEHMGFRLHRESVVRVIERG